MLELYKNALDEQGVFDGEVPEIIQALSSSINNYKIPSRMKKTIAVSELILFFSQFHKHIRMPDGSIVPINAISFCISPSGTGKDSSVSAVRNCFANGYKLINELRLERAKARAIRLAEADDVAEAHLFENYKSYYTHPQSLFAAPDSTIEGLIADFNELQEEQLGSGAIYSGEIADEMGRGIADIMQFLSETYDKGNKEVKKIKGMHKLKPLDTFPVSALLMGSPAGIIFDPMVAAQFVKSFATKLARRSYFMYAPEKIQKPNFKSITEADRWMTTLAENANSAKMDVSPFIVDITKEILASDEEYVDLSEETLTLFNRYKAYNEELAETIPPRFQISKLVREHLQWKSLKFAGAIALSKGKFTIDPEDYIEAVTFAESLNEDMTAFEIELGKEPYERFVDFMHIEAFDNTFEISLHELRKMGFIPTTGKPPERIKELINLASSYDVDGIYTPTEDGGVTYSKQILTDELSVSYLEVSGPKDQRAKQCAKGFESSPCTFPDLADMLSQDLAYSPFKFKDGIRGKDNIEGGCKWIVLDIDNSNITAEEAHFTLSHINHHIALTSDADNEFKFRVLIELDAMVDIPNIQWKPFIASISSNLALDADPLGKAQIFFSYADRSILSTLDADPLPTKEHILAATEIPPPTIKKLTPTERSALLKDLSGTFEYAFECGPGARSVTLMRAAYHAKDLGMQTEEILDLMDSINDYWLSSLPEEEMDRNIKSQIRRW